MRGDFSSTISQRCLKSWRTMHGRLCSDLAYNCNRVAACWLAHARPTKFYIPLVTLSIKAVLLSPLSHCNTTLHAQHHTTVGLPEPVVAPPPPDPKLEESTIQDLVEKELGPAVVDEFMLPKKKKRRRPVCLLLSVRLSACLSVCLSVCMRLCMYVDCLFVHWLSFTWLYS